MLKTEETTRCAWPRWRARVATCARSGDPDNGSPGVARPTSPGKLLFDATSADAAIRVE